MWDSSGSVCNLCLLITLCDTPFFMHFKWISLIYNFDKNDYIDFIVLFCTYLCLFAGCHVNSDHKKTDLRPWKLRPLEVNKKLNLLFLNFYHLKCFIITLPCQSNSEKLTWFKTAADTLITFAGEFFTEEIKRQSHYNVVQIKVSFVFNGCNSDKPEKINIKSVVYRVVANW